MRNERGTREALAGWLRGSVALPPSVTLHSTQMMLKRPDCSPLAGRSSHHRNGTPRLLEPGSAAQAALVAGTSRREAG